eukprot:TRINITY_DN31615_c0_g1_i1.p1 TRINITY_DN31615_c0_g1~~TRINITY_DN31615_c0_g1_i1.p1  ORF type:complete len:277 (+),score=23.19 TRINITY_DN31615_c0_g1_i1:57-887(+)
MTKTDSLLEQAADKASYDLWFRRKEFLGVPVFVVWYWIWAKMSEQSGMDIALSQAPLATSVWQGLAALLSTGVLLDQLCIQPPDVDEDLYRACRVFSRWIFLTRHVMALQSVHLIASFVGVFWQISWLVQMTDGMTYLVGSLGSFITTQFFLLVWPSPQFAAHADLMEKKGRPIRTRAAVVHIPGLILALLDIFLCKDAARLERDCPLATSCCMGIAYGTFYIGFIALNYKATGEWPYGLLHNLTTAPKWAGFVLVQYAVVIVPIVCFWTLNRFAQ